MKICGRPYDLVSTGLQENIWKLARQLMIFRANFGERVEEKSENMKLDKLKMQLFINIAGQQYLYTSFLLNFLGRYRP
jgi:hypothetical protein